MCVIDGYATLNAYYTLRICIRLLLVYIFCKKLEQEYARESFVYDGILSCACQINLHVEGYSIDTLNSGARSKFSIV